MLSSQSWPLQTQPQLLTVTPPTVTSSASVQLSRSQESLMQSTIHRPLTFSQQIRPQQPQLAVVTQKPMLSVTRHAGYYTGLFIYSLHSKLNGGLSWLHSADEDAVSWLTNYGK